MPSTYPCRVDSTAVNDGTHFPMVHRARTVARLCLEQTASPPRWVQQTATAYLPPKCFQRSFAWRPTGLDAQTWLFYKPAHQGLDWRQRDGALNHVDRCEVSPELRNLPRAFEYKRRWPPKHSTRLWVEGCLWDEQWYWGRFYREILEWCRLKEVKEYIVTLV